MQPPAGSGEFDAYAHMKVGSANLLNALVREHFHIVQILTKKNGTGSGRDTREEG